MRQVARSTVWRAGWSLVFGLGVMSGLVDRCLAIEADRIEGTAKLDWERDGEWVCGSIKTKSSVTGLHLLATPIIGWTMGNRAKMPPFFPTSRTNTRFSPALFPAVSRTRRHRLPDCIQCMNSVYAAGSFRADDSRSVAASGLTTLAR